MAERIDKLALKDGVNENFLDGPAEFLCKTIARLLIADPKWKAIFSDFIDPYKRMDYPMRALPCLRVYNNTLDKTAESWFIEGDVLLDCILPANLRRNDLQQVQDTLSAALLQQFRRRDFFLAVEAACPGLNELGKRFSVDKSLGFEWGEDLVPLTQMTVNFRIDLREWDRYLEDQSRTVNDPYEKTLGELTKIFTRIEGLNDSEAVQVIVATDDQKPGEE